MHTLCNNKMSAFLWVSLLGAVALYLLYRLLRAQFWLLSNGDPNAADNPFRSYARGRNGQEVECDQKKRDAVLKQSFSPDKVPSSLDAIVVGSGIGGLSTAALLAKTGKKVLVLDQHDQAGGCCHTFIDKGFEFDVGIHYIGEMAEGTMSRVLVDQLCDSGIQWVELEPVLDTVIIGMGQEASKRREYPVYTGRGKQLEYLLKTFPEEEKGIRKFFDLLKRTRRTITVVAALKMLPKWFSHLLLSSGIVARLAPDLKYTELSLTQVLDQLVTNEELKAVLAYSFGDYGTVPKDAPFFMQAVLTNHFLHGGYYPRGGASEIAYNIIPTIEAAGGRVLVRSKVTSILMDEGYNKVVGVTVKQGHNVYDIMAPLVISDAGLHNTLDSLVPHKAVSKCGLDRVLGQVRHGVGLMSVFVGLDGTPDELGLKKSHIWAFTGANLDQIMEDFTNTQPENVGSAMVPLMFLSFPSTKDPTYSQRFPGKSTIAIVTVAPYEWFEAWKNERVQHRGDDYDGLKMTLGNQLWSQVVDLFPQLDGRKVYMDVGTPLSNMYYLGTPRGEVYGVDHNTKRFNLKTVTDMRPELGIPGLYLTGQDVFTCGFAGAMYGGLFCASTILKRNLMNDLQRLTKQAKKKSE